ncbi:predicted protein [Nematostella vectensis]|uniref:WD repeat-containing protein 63 n=1 Tax=Nematostella vectensis TaxID=45351 RepID=A7T2S2_NEMVE|nr:predicted protein [Nematostella vectensis]|eukprot:XP_001621843.1 hypothetical protein NEMVEDRAFT_v1g221510 [Nematostella vectensis]
MWYCCFPFQSYPAEELLIVYDPAFKYGQNFYLCLTEEAKERHLNPPKEELGEGEEIEGEEEVEEGVFRRFPRTPQPWESLGSELEVEEEVVVENRPKVKFRISRLRREFGAPVSFTTHSATDAKGGLIDCPSYDEETPSFKKMEFEKAIQAVSVLEDVGSQTDWLKPCNAATQYVPREFEEYEKEKINKSLMFKNFVNKVTPRFELALQQNEIMNVFYDDYESMADDETTFGAKSDNYLKEYQSFTDLLYSKEKTITSIEWHPSIKGIIGVSCGERLLFDERIDQSSRILMTASLVLIWSFSDPIHPLVLLQAPDEIHSFKFNPSDPNIIAGGCINGQTTVQRQTGTGEFGPKVFSIFEKQSKTKGKPSNESADADNTGVSRLPSNVAKGKDQGKPLENVSTKFLVGTEEGDLVYLDWRPEKDTDSGKIMTPRPEHVWAAHDGPINTLQVSPFFKDIILTVGGWTFAIWKEGVNSDPLLLSSSHIVKLTKGHWSPSRPGVFFIAKADGMVDVWDLLDRSHEPSLTQNITAATITTIFPHQVSTKNQKLIKNSLKSSSKFDGFVDISHISKAIQAR